MKEATGELNMTVVAVVAIAALGTLFAVFIWPSIKVNLALSNACASTGDGTYKTTLKDGSEINCVAQTNKMTCTYKDADSGKTSSKVCKKQ